jgi:hypothetical protein
MKAAKPHAPVMNAVDGSGKVHAHETTCKCSGRTVSRRYGLCRSDDHAHHSRDRATGSCQPRRMARKRSAKQASAPPIAVAADGQRRASPTMLVHEGDPA